MNSPTKQQISADLNKVKTAGGQRLERIGRIIQDALSQTVNELKEGGSEIQTIAKESTLVENLKTKSTAPAAPVEVKIGDETVEVESIEIAEDVADDVTDEQIAESILEELHAESTSVEPTNEAAKAEPAIVQSLVNSLNAAINQIGAFARDEKTQAAVQPYLAKLQAVVERLDEKASARYGERYSSFKQGFQQDMGKAKTWYTETRANMGEDGTVWAEQKQSELEAKMSKAGATIAQKEAKIKQIVKELWQTVSKA